MDALRSGCMPGRTSSRTSPWRRRTAKSFWRGPSFSAGCVTRPSPTRTTTSSCCGEATIARSPSATLTGKHPRADDLWRPRPHGVRSLRQGDALAVHLRRPSRRREQSFHRAALAAGRRLDQPRSLQSASACTDGAPPAAEPVPGAQLSLRRAATSGLPRFQPGGARIVGRGPGVGREANAASAVLRGRLGPSGLGAVTGRRTGVGRASAQYGGRRIRDPADRASGGALLSDDAVGGPSLLERWFHGSAHVLARGSGPGMYRRHGIEGGRRLSAARRPLVRADVPRPVARSAAFMAALRRSGARVGGAPGTQRWGDIWPVGPAPPGTGPRLVGHPGESGSAVSEAHGLAMAAVDPLRADVPPDEPGSVAVVGGAQQLGYPPALCVPAAPGRPTAARTP